MNLFARGDPGPASTWAQLLLADMVFVTSICAPLQFYVSNQTAQALAAARVESGLPGNQNMALYTDAALRPGATTTGSPCALRLPGDPAQAPQCWPAGNILWVKDVSLASVTQDLEAAAAWVPAYYRIMASNAYCVCETIADMECIKTQGLSGFDSRLHACPCTHAFLRMDAFMHARTHVPIVEHTHAGTHRSARSLEDTSE